jgi:hypothetical protein
MNLFLGFVPPFHLFSYIFLSLPSDHEGRERQKRFPNYSEFLIIDVPQNI